MQSPNQGYELRRLAGDADALERRGTHLTELGATMATTAAQLLEIGDSSIHKSKGTDALAETASETAVDLEAAGVRYEETGKVVTTYAAALDTAQTWIHPRIDDIEAAERDYQSALDTLDDRQDDLSGLERVWVWEDDPTEAELASAEGAVGQARTELTAAEEARNALWSEFESTFGTWSDAYDDACGGIEQAMETAGNNDGFWEMLDNLLDVLGVILIVLSVIALIIGAPLAGLLGLIILGLAVLVLAANLLKFAAGRATLSDVAWSAVGLLPFGIGKVLSRGAPALSTVMRTGRGTVVNSIRGGLPGLRLTTPFRNVSTAWTWLRAPANARGALPHPGMFANPLRSIAAGGPEAVQINRFIGTMRGSSYADDLAGLISTTSGAMPGSLTRVVNIGVWSSFAAIDVGGVFKLQPPIPGLRDVTIG